MNRLERHVHSYLSTAGLWEVSWTLRVFQNEHSTPVEVYAKHTSNLQFDITGSDEAVEASMVCVKEM